jgi:MFS transporter, DHA3 family, macrolide efflux protein
MKNQSTLFTNKNFIFFFLAALIGVFGEGIYGLTAIVLVLEKTESIVEISKMLVLTLLPSVLLAPFVGVLIDTFDKVKMALICNILRFVTIGMIPASFYLGFFHPFIFYFSVFLSYIIWYVLEPVKESILKEILAPEQYRQGISMVQGAWQVGLLSSAIIAGILMDQFGNIQSILVSGFTYLLAGALFISIKIKVYTTKAETHSINFKKYMQEMSEGWQYLFQNKRAFHFVLTTSMFLPFIYGINTLIVPFNYRVLLGDSVSLGIIDSGAGVGSLLSAVICTLLVRKQRLMKTILISIILTGISTILFSFTNSIFLSFSMYLAIGIFIGNVKVLSRILVFEYVEQRFIGRVMTAVTFLSLTLSIVMSVLIAFVAETNITLAYAIIGIFMAIPFIFTFIGSRKVV